MINLAIKDEKKEQQLDGIKRKVKAITTGVLVTYVVGLAGVVGWGIYWSSRENKVSEDFLAASSEVARYAEEEILARKISDRINRAELFLEERADMTGVLKAILPVDATVSAMLYSAGVMEVTIEATNSQTIRDYALEMEGKFVGVKLVELKYEDNYWAGKVDVKGLKK